MEGFVSSKMSKAKRKLGKVDGKNVSQTNMLFILPSIFKKKKVGREIVSSFGTTSNRPAECDSTIERWLHRSTITPQVIFQISALNYFESFNLPETS